MIIDNFNFDLVANSKYDSGKIPIDSYIQYDINNTSVDSMSIRIPENIVIVDVDNEYNADILFKLYKNDTYWVKTTRGYHFYFKISKYSTFKEFYKSSNFSAGKYSLLGFKVDYKKNLPKLNNGNISKEYATVKKDGKIRETSNKKIINELPIELYPLCTTNIKDSYSDYDLFNLINLNENRNSTLLKIMCKIKHIIDNYYHKSFDIITHLLYFINNKILPNSLTDKEIKGLLKSIKSYQTKDNDSTQVDKVDFTSYSQDSNEFENNEYKLLEQGLVGLKNTKIQEFVDNLVNLIIKEYIVVRYQQNLYIKDTDKTNVVFENMSDPVIMGAFLEKLGVKISSKAFVADIIFKCEVRAKKIEDEEMSVLFKNGYVLDQDTGEVLPYNNEFSNIIIDVDFNPNYENHTFSKKEMFYRNTVDKFLEFVSDGGITSEFYAINPNNPEEHDNGEAARFEVNQVLDQILGHCLMTKHCPHYAYFFTGSIGSNGKSTLFGMIKNLIGNKNTSSLSLVGLTEPYNLAQLTNSLVNIGDDINSSFIESSTEFKTIVTSNPITIRDIRERPIQTTLFTTLLYNCNNMPVFKDKSGGIERRLKIIPMAKRVDEKDRNERLDMDLSNPAAKQRLIERALKGFKMLRKNKGIIKFGKVIDMQSELYFQSIDSIKAFIHEEMIKNDEINNKDIKYENKILTLVKTWHNEKLNNIYKTFEDFCRNDGRTNIISKNKFKDRITSDYNLNVKWTGEEYIVYVNESSTKILDSNIDNLKL